MAVTFASGFEARQAATDGFSSLSGTASYSTAQQRTGAASIQCNPASGASGYIFLSAAVTTYLHFGLRVASAPSVERTIFSIAQAGQINLRLTSTGALAVYLNTTLIGTSSVLSAGWHWIGLRNVTGTSVAFLQIDGSDAVTGTATVGSTDNRLGFVGTEASAVDVYFDDVIIDDAGFLAPSKVDIALPISDATVTGVTDGNGGTSNLWECVNNTPPAGVATGSEATTPTVNIRYPSSTGSTAVYKPNLETYTTLGVGASDTVLAVQGVFRHGEDVATGTKAGSYVGITNPTQTDNSAFNFGDDGGAHGAEVGLWITKFGTLVTSPSVTLGTSPTIEVDRATQSRVGCVDFMGLVVAWTPATTSVTPLAHYVPVVNQAVQRASSY